MTQADRELIRLMRICIVICTVAFLVFGYVASQRLEEYRQYQLREAMV